MLFRSMPAGLDSDFSFIERYDRLADEFDSADAALHAVDEHPERVRDMLRAPWMTGLDPNMWTHDDPAALARAIRGIVRDHPIADRELLRGVTSPVLLVCVDGDPIHPVELGRVLHSLLPNSELLVYGSGEELFQAIPDLLPKVVGFLGGA